MLHKGIWLSSWSVHIPKKLSPQTPIQRHTRLINVLTTMARQLFRVTEKVVYINLERCELGLCLHRPQQFTFEAVIFSMYSPPDVVAYVYLMDPYTIKITYKCDCLSTIHLPVEDSEVDRSAHTFFEFGLCSCCA